MKINQVEELVGITKKNIRFYEDQGLLNPERNPENGYREYGLEDVSRLHKIKLLRKLDVPIEEIKKLFENRDTLKNCMENHLIELDHRQQNLEILKQMCADMSEHTEEFSQLDATAYLEEMDRLERGGTEFMDIEKRDIRRKKRGPIVAAAVMIGFFLLMLVVFFWASAMAPLPPLVAIVVLISIMLPIIGVAVALVQRLKEIDGGEEDEARKY